MIIEKSFVKLMKDEEGQGMVEYSLIIILIAIALVAALGFVKDGLVAFFGKAKDIFNSTVAAT